MSEDASLASASASAPEVATAWSKKRGRPPANKIAVKLYEMTRLTRCEEMPSNPSISKWLLSVVAKEVFFLDLRAQDVQGVPHHEVVCQDERHARSHQL